ncbi:SpoIIE family protein phosphatase [Streptosporangium sp. NBC_01756]|uniref:SpoIIE family protein phosphatase n=1 Tax=Streptosporangium sp. NBC_01756 TaxID=2975950 RepID=UPI002DD84895|nr:SpoIIE family protein phosphatase [Streptosporangium sp. NBC_01756]WSC88341.1 SpoIIE family protein phosphatase [Streptosporangium sp. NBC_01756]
MQKETPFGGEMGERIRAYDWAATPLGAMDQWSTPLRGAVDMALSSRMQIVLFWGPDYIAVYNDSYIPTIGAKHPAALGRPAVENWQETWDVLRPLLDRVRETGEPFWHQDHPFLLVRHGFLEQTYFDISYGPIRLADGTVGGVLCLVSETTGRVLSERRLRVLSRVGAATSGMVTRQEVAQAVVATLGEAPDDVPLALVYLLGEDGELRLAVPHDTAPARIGQDDLRWPAGSRDTGTELPGERFGVPGQVIALPLTSGTDVLGALVCGTNPLLQPHGGYQEFFEVLATSVARALSSAETHEQGRHQAQALTELDNAKTAFFANISHELRTPLALILGPLQELLDDSSLSAEHHTVLRVARRNALRLLTLVNDVLDFTSIDSGRARARYQPTDLAEQTAELTSLFRSSMEKIGLTLRLEGGRLPEPVHVDRRMWERIVFNLLSNALKHTFTGGVTVGVRSGEGHAVVTVSDTGVGIPDHELPHLFERFHQVGNSPSRDHEGTGIGLALVRELITLHGGRIEADSRVGGGTTFTITLPYGSAHLPHDQIDDAATPYRPGQSETVWLPVPDEPAVVRGPAAAPETEPGAGRPARERILVADDNADLRGYLVRLLSPHWTVTAVADGAAALDAAREQTPDLVIADVMMPGMDGLELVRRLRADPGTRSVSIMLLSARAGQEESLTGLTAGADEYLVKPFSARELLTRVRGVLRLAAARSRHNRQLRELTEAALAINEASTVREVLALTEKYSRLLTDSPQARAALGDLPAEPPGIAVPAETADADDTVLRQLSQLTTARLENLEQLEVEHRIATTLQHALLPEVPAIHGAEIVGRYLPGNDDSSVGGDWYDVIRVSDDEVVLVIGDIVGKGVKAAASMGQMRNALRAYALEDPDPGRTLGRLNRMTTGRYDRMHGTVLCVQLWLSTGRLRYSSAGHPPVLICRANGEADYLDGALAPLIGAKPSTVFSTAETRLAPGDRLLLYTDGIVEKRSADILTGMARLRDEMARAAGLGLDAQLESLLALIDGEDHRDDVALLGLALALA